MHQGDGGLGGGSVYLLNQEKVKYIRTGMEDTVIIVSDKCIRIMNVKFLLNVDLEVAWILDSNDLDFNGNQLKDIVDVMIFKNVMLLDVRLLPTIAGDAKDVKRIYLYEIDLVRRSVIKIGYISIAVRTPSIGGYSVYFSSRFNKAVVVNYFNKLVHEYSVDLVLLQLPLFGREILPTCSTLMRRYGKY